jgi:hypothetical protein
MVRCGGIDVATTITRAGFRGVRVLTTPPHRVRRAGARFFWPSRSRPQCAGRFLTWTFRVLGAAALFAVAADHLYEYRVDHYSAIPTIGTLFLLNGFSATALGLTLLVATERRLPRRLATVVVPSLAASGIAIAATSLTALFVSESTPLFGFMEFGYRPIVVLAIAAEAATIVFLTALLVSIRRAGPRAGYSGRPRTSQPFETDLGRAVVGHRSEQLLAELRRGRLAELAQPVAVVDCLADQRGAEVTGVGVANRSRCGDDRDALVARHIPGVEVASVDDVLRGHRPSCAMATRDGDVDLRRAHVAELMEFQGGIVGQHPLHAHRPQRRLHVAVERARWQRDHAIQALATPFEQPPILQNHQPLRRDPELPSLLLGHEPVVVGSQLKDRLVNRTRHDGQYISK